MLDRIRAPREKDGPAGQWCVLGHIRHIKHTKPPCGDWNPPRSENRDYPGRDFELKKETISPVQTNNQYHPLMHNKIKKNSSITDITCYYTSTTIYERIDEQTNNFAWDQQMNE